MCTFDGITCHHDLLVTLFADQYASADIIDVLALELCLRHNDNTPQSIIIQDFNQPTVWLNTGILNVQRLAQIIIHTFQSIIYFLL